MHAGRAIAVFTVVLGASAVSCTRGPVERSSVTAELGSDESTGTESPAPAQGAPVPAQGSFALDGGSTFPTPSLDAGSSFPGPSPSPSPGGFDGGAPFAPIPGPLAEPAHDPTFDAGVPEPIELDAAVGPDVDGAAVEPIEVDGGTSPQPM